MAAREKIRLHFKDGRIVTESMTAFAHKNGIGRIEAKMMIADWVRDGDLKLRTDGGYDVINYKPRKEKK